MKEIFRFYFSVFGFIRVMDKDGELGGYRILVGILINIGVFILYNSFKYWNEFEKFNFERFLILNDENEVGYLYYVYILFLFGLRHCVG